MSAANKRRPCRKCGKNRAERFFTSARGHTCATCRKKRTQYASREVRLWETYGITLEEYAAILEAQGGVCAICKGKRPYLLHVDHDHLVERELIAQGVTPRLATKMSVRGLLCKQDNRGLLPAAHDSIDRLQAAIEYLNNWPANAVLGVPLWVC